jgi:hypothetical protein
MIHHMLTACLVLASMSVSVSLAQDSTLASDLAKLRSDLSALVKAGYITKEDVSAVLAQVREARADRVVTDEERAAIQASVDALKAKVPQEVKDSISADVSTIRNDLSSLISSKVPAEVQEAAKAVVADLKAIRSGGYLSRDDLQVLKGQITSSLPGGLSEEEKTAIQQSVQGLAAGIPSDLSAQLASDLAALAAALKNVK